MTLKTIPHFSPVRGAWRFLKICVGLGIFGLAALFCCGAYLYFHFSQDLPSIQSLDDYQPHIVSEVYDQTGKKIGEFWKECRFLVPYEQIPKKVIDAFIASEDARFWEHGGVDPQSILRAFFENLRAGKIVQGGSTITQQVTRSLLLTREKKLDRKVKEALLATQMEQELSKEQILYIYLNQIYLGNRSYGIAAAARNYFRKTLAELTTAEIALIAGLPSAPSQYDPFVSGPKAKEVQKRVLDRLVANNYITQAEAHASYAAPLKLHKGMSEDADYNQRFTPYFTETIRQTVSKKYGEDLLYKGGLKIMTTVDLRMSRLAVDALQNGLQLVENGHAYRGVLQKWAPDEINDAIGRIEDSNLLQEDPAYALLNDGTLSLAEDSTPKMNKLYRAIVLDVDASSLKVAVGHWSGLVMARDYRWTGHRFQAGEEVFVRRVSESNVSLFAIAQEPELEGALLSYETSSGRVRALIGGYDFKRSEFNRALQSKRQAGSAFKPIVYAAALDKGYKPGTMLVDSPVTFQLDAEEFYTPRNYADQYKGTMTLRSALAQSINVVAVKVLYDIGVDYMAAYGYKLGITTPIRRYISTALGASDTSLKDLSVAYGAFANQGIRPDLRLIEKVSDQTGQVLEEAPPPLSHEPQPDWAPDYRPTDNELNPNLFTEGNEIIKEYGLKLSNEELRILYGTAIPRGHVISPQTAYLMTHLLSDVVTRGTATRARALGRPAAGKTGTTNEDTDCWFIGYTPELLTGVWVGYDNIKTLGDHMTGGVVATPIWLDFMAGALEGTPIAQFHKPDSIPDGSVEWLSGGSAVFASKPVTNAPVSRHMDAPSDTPNETAPKSDSSSRGIEFLFGD